jgi:hypothetical protein
MKAYSADLMALLQSEAPVDRVQLFAIGPLKNGSYIYACEGQLPVKYNGNTYQPTQFGSWSRGNVTVKIGLDSNATDLTVFADNQVPVYFPGTSSGCLLLDGVKFGLLGNAGVTVYRLYNSPYLAGYAFPAVLGPTGGSLVETVFVGQCAAVPKIGMTACTITVQDLLYLLNIQVPRRLIQASCSHVVYDQGCTLAAAAYTKTSAVQSLPFPYAFWTTTHMTPTSALGTFTQGMLTWTSGRNAGLTYQVRNWTPGPSSDSITLDVAPIFPIAAGDAFKVQQGCNKTFASCADLQGSPANAYQNYGGEPDTPVPETAIG